MYLLKNYSFLFPLFFSLNLSAQNKPVTNVDNILNYPRFITLSKDSLTPENIAAKVEGVLKNFTSGTIFFSGTGFPNVEVATAFGSVAPIHSLMLRCGIGTKIVLENCIFLNADGSFTKSVNKIMTIQ